VQRAVRIEGIRVDNLPLRRRPRHNARS